MWKLLGAGGRLCDGITRRDCLRIGALSVGGLTLPQLLRAEQLQGVRQSRKSVIMIYLCGAPPHQDMFDLKMNAPSEIRGDFTPIDTNIPGIEFCEHLPKLAGMADKLAVINSVFGSPNGSHDSFICYTGQNYLNQPAGGWPSFGSVVSRILGPRSAGVPPFVGLAPDAGHPPYGSPGLPGFLGVSHAAFRPSGPGREDMVLKDVATERLADRRQLLTAVDQFRRTMDVPGAMDGLDAITEQAFGILTSSALAEALDISREPESVRERYGQGQATRVADAAPMDNTHFLMARRLIEAGARVVTLNFGRWDFHTDNFGVLPKKHFHFFDQGMSALVNDLHERGMADDVAVVAWGEFGRTPRINKDAGRDHWPQVGNALLAGGGFRTGQVIGATDRLAAEITDRPVHFSEVLATLYNHLGINNLDTLTLPDLSGRPQFLLKHTTSMPELVG